MFLTRYHLRQYSSSIALLDFVCLVIGSITGILLRVGADEMPLYVYNHIDGWFIFIGSIILANYLAGSYRVNYMFSRFNVVVTWFFSLVFAVIVISITSFAWFQLLLGRGVLLFAITIYSVLSLMVKLLMYEWLFHSDKLACKVVITGCNELAERIRNVLESKWVVPKHHVITWLCFSPETDESKGHWGDYHDGIPVVRVKYDELDKRIRDMDVNLVVPAVKESGMLEKLYAPLRKLRYQGVEVISPLSVFEIYSGKTPVEFLTNRDLFHATLESRLLHIFRVKRFIDIFVSVTAGLLLAPFAFLIAIAIKLSDQQAPIFYLQERVGRFGKIFKIIKFRTMVPYAEAQSGPVWAGDDDKRVTRIGKFLRRFRLDEIPQLWNVLKGEMSIVGPRPERPEIVTELARVIPFFSERENLLPGLTGWAQIQFPYGKSIEDAKRKLEYDIYYMKYMSISLDLQIILRTLRIILFGVGESQS